MSTNKFKIAVVQAAPVFLDLDASIAKACKFIKEAAKNGAKLVLFPEAFIPGYPDWIWNVPAGNIALHQKLYAKLLKNSMSIDGLHVKKLSKTAKKYDITVVIGINEKSKSKGSIYNTILFINHNGKLLGHHQKLIPTLAERMIWSYGSPSTLNVFHTKTGTIGSLTCWENYMPLVRYTLYTQGIEIYMAPTYDESAVWQASMCHIAREGGVYVLSTSMAYKKSDILAKLPELKKYYKDVGEWVNQGNSIIVAPGGNIIAGPLNKKEDILYAKVNIKKTKEVKWNLDVSGHYSRPDAFSLHVKQVESKY